MDKILRQGNTPYETPFLFEQFSYRRNWLNEGLLLFLESLRLFGLVSYLDVMPK